MSNFNPSRSTCCALVSGGVNLKLLTCVAALGLTALTVQSPAHATATASFSVSEYTCSEFAGDGTLISTSTQQGPSNSIVGPPGKADDLFIGQNFHAAGCSASLSSGEYLTMSANVNLAVSDQGLSGAKGGDYFINPYLTGGATRHVPAGFEYAYAVAAVGTLIDYRYENPSYGGGGDVASIGTIQDGLPDNNSFSGIVAGRAYRVTDSPQLELCPLCPVTAYLWLQVDVFAASGVPEPETYAMLLAGLGLMGFAARRNAVRV